MLLYDARKVLIKHGEILLYADLLDVVSLHEFDTLLSLYILSRVLYTPDSMYSW